MILSNPAKMLHDVHAPHCFISCDVAVAFTLLQTQHSLRFMVGIQWLFLYQTFIYLVNRSHIDKILLLTYCTYIYSPTPLIWISQVTGSTCISGL